MVRILLIDDQEEIRDALSMHLSIQEGIEIAGVAASGYEGILKAQSCEPDVILTDLRMPGINGIETTQEILKRSGDKKPKILILTAYEDDEYIFEALEAGASGYLLKDTEIEDVANAIRLVHTNGSQQFAEKLERKVLDRLRPYQSIDNIQNNPVRFMTDRESKIVTCLAKGETDQEIADHLQLSVQEVLSHVESLKNSLNLNSRESLVEWSKKQEILN